MRRKLIAALLALALIGAAAMAVLTALDMKRVWGDAAACSIDSLTRQDLTLLPALHPDKGWTAYTQSMPRQITGDGLSGRAAEPSVLSFLGTPDRIAFFPLTFGRLPQDGEQDACALDEDTAFRLFGSIAPGEVSVRLDGRPVRVVGVIEAPQPLMLIPAQDHAPVRSSGEEEAQSVAFDRLVADDRAALLVLTSTLGSQPDPFELSGAELFMLIGLLCAVPWVLAATFLVAALRRWGGGWRHCSTALLCAIALGALLGALRCIPVRFLPNRWSDLAFYGEQLNAWKSRPFRMPDVRDQLLKSDTLRTVLWCAATSILLALNKIWRLRAAVSGERGM